MSLSRDGGRGIQAAQPRSRLGVQASTSRTITLGGRELLFFGGCGYLALAHHPRVVAALVSGAERHGVSSGASRETTGNVDEHEALEREIAAALELESALLAPEGACANLALAESLTASRPGATEGAFPLALVDREAHPTVLHAARLGSERVVELADEPSDRARIAAVGGRVAIWTDGVFPSSGRAANLRHLLSLLEPGRGLLIVDDCHGLGVLGRRGRGSLEAAGISDPRIVVTGTLSKALGTYGGFIAGGAERVAHVRASSEIYAGTTPLAPPLAAAARTALGILVADTQRFAAYQNALREFRRQLRALSLPMHALEFPVVAFELDPPERMTRLRDFALDRGVYLPLIHYSGGGPNGFFRIVWNAAHTAQDLERLTDAIRGGLQRP